MSRRLTTLAAAPLVFALAARSAHAADPPPDDRSWSDALVPDTVSIVVGAQLPMLLIYEAPGPLLGVEVGWRLSPVTELIANVGLGVLWETGTQRYVIPIGIGVRVTPWEVGPWFHLALGTTPWLEHIGIVLPERDIGITDGGATMTIAAKLGVDLWGWDIGVGYEHNLLPSPFYEHYKGDETLPWLGSFVAWVGIPVWTRSDR